MLKLIFQAINDILELFALIEYILIFFKVLHVVSTIGGIAFIVIKLLSFTGIYSLVLPTWLSVIGIVMTVIMVLGGIVRIIEAI